MKSKLFIILPVLVAALSIFIFTGSCQMDSDFLEKIDEKIAQDEMKDEESVETYRVYYFTGDQESGNVPVDETEYEPGEIVTILGNTGELVLSNNIFRGWSLEIENTSPDYLEGESFEMGTSADPYHWMETI